MKSPLLLSSLTTLALIAGGCATSNQQAKVQERVDQPEGRVYQPAGSAALAFDPPIAFADGPQPTFDRTGRAPEAFAGYEDQVTTYSYTHQRDEIRVFNDAGRLERRAYTDRTSVVRR